VGGAVSVDPVLFHQVRIHLNIHILSVSVSYL
jgi:hypothetical protein